MNHFCIGIYVHKTTCLQENANSKIISLILYYKKQVRRGKVQFL